MAKVTTQDQLIQSILTVDMTPEQDVFMKRFGANFRIKALDSRTIAHIRERASRPAKGGGLMVDEEQFSLLMLEKGVTSPDWSNAQILEKFGPHAVDAIKARLLPGEIARLNAEIMKLSGFGEEDEAIDDAKN